MPFLSDVITAASTTATAAPPDNDIITSITPVFNNDGDVLEGPWTRLPVSAVIAAGVCLLLMLVGHCGWIVWWLRRRHRRQCDQLSSTYVNNDVINYPMESPFSFSPSVQYQQEMDQIYAQISHRHLARMRGRSHSTRLRESEGLDAATAAAAVDQPPLQLSLATPSPVVVEPEAYYGLCDATTPCSSCAAIRRMSSSTDDIFTHHQPLTIGSTATTTESSSAPTIYELPRAYNAPHTHY